ncbi:MAG: glycosyltransferase family 4 protein [Bacteroidia bacterium]|nr:glycosyltransferase family 4 protein [Bacteroidia bacterium]
MIRIGFDAKRAFFNTTGLGNYSRTVIETIIKYGKHNEYFAYSPVPDRHEVFDLPFHEYPHLHLRFPSFSSGPWSAYWRSWGIARDIKRDKLDIFHGLSNEMPFSLAGMKIRKVVTLHDLIFLRYPESYPFWDRNIHYHKARFVCRHADVIITMSKQSEEDIHHFFPESKGKVQVIPPIAPRSFREFRFDSGISDQINQKYNLPERYILYVGSIALRKNVSSLIQAMKLLPENIPLIIAGNGNLKKEVQKQIRELNLQSRVRIISGVTQAEIPYFYRKASVFVYPSVFEGFGLPIQEALLSGVPVIAGNNSCFQEAGGEGGLYVHQTNPGEIAAAILDILHNPTLAASLIEKGKRHLNHFTEEKITAEYLKLYDSLR